jgi:hypothetical protein
MDTTGLSSLADSQLGKYTDTYTTFSGADIVASFGGVTVGTLMGITWSVTREKAPIYTMGSPSPRSFSRGKRGIAGSLIFQVFDRPGLYDMLNKKIATNEAQYFTRSSNILPGTDSTNRHRGIVPVGTQAMDVRAAMPYYMDQIPPFDVTITFANEYGQAAVRSIYGVELLNEGSGASMEDMVMEETMTFIARELGPMYATGRPRDGITDFAGYAPDLVDSYIDQGNLG